MTAAQVRNTPRRAIASVLAVVALACGAHASAQQLPSSVHGIIVKLKPASASGRESPQQAREQLSRVFIGKAMALGSVKRTGKDAHTVRWARDLSADEARRLMDSLRQDPRVAWVAPNVRERLLQAASPNDPVYATNQWWLSASSTSSNSRGVPNIAEAWEQATGDSPSVNVAVLDTGLLTTHPDLSGARFSAGYDMVTDEDGLSGDGDGRDANFSDPGDAVAANECPSGNQEEDSSWHGSRIAGMIGAITNNAAGVAGINRGARIVSVRVAGKCGALVADIIDGMRWAAGLQVDGVNVVNANPAKVVNISFGSANTDCTPYQETIDELASEGVLVIAAAGNENGFVNRPARCDGVLAVGAVRRNGAKASYSNFGSQIDITTVGGEVTGAADGGLYSTSNNGETAPQGNVYQPAFGTSFSTPIVTGVASLMLAVNSSLTPAQLTDGIRSTARRHVTSGAGSLPSCPATDGAGSCYCTRSTCGAGLLDAPAALTYAADPASGSGSGGGDGGDGGGGGGGALGLGGLLGLALAVIALAWAPWTRVSAGSGFER